MFTDILGLAREFHGRYLSGVMRPRSETGTADDHRPFAYAAQLLTEDAGVRHGDDNSRKKVHNTRGHSSAAIEAESQLATPKCRWGALTRP